MSRAWHTLLARQLKQVFGAEGPPSSLTPLLERIDAAYRDADEDRRLSERALEITSQDLQDRNERLRVFFETAPFLMGTARVTDADVIVVSANSAAMRALGIALRRPTPLAESALPTEEIARWRERADAALEAHGPVQFDYRMGQGSGARTLRATVTRLPSAVQDGLVCFVVEDVTERQRLFEQLVLQDRRAAIGTLAAGVAHEINNPLSYVLTNLVLAKEDLDALPAADLSAERLREALAPILECLRDAASGASRVQAIVSDLKVFGASERHELKAVDLVAVLRFAAKMAGTAMRPKARFSLELRDTPMVLGDETRLGQVFLNLLINASEAIPPGRADENEIRVEVRTDATGMAEVDVHDTGAGIPRTVLDRIFDPFFTTRATAGGTGLGLAVCVGILNSIGGDIAVVRSEPDRGSTFRVRLKPAVMVEEPTSSSLPPPTTRGRVLVIDDDPHVAGAMRRALTREHEVVSAVGVRAAIDILRGDPSFDVILCDLRMPAGGGVAVFRAIQSIAPALVERFVIVTGDPSSADLGAIRRELAHPVVEKPFDPRTLRNVVRAVVSHASR